jgi:hypothetical protein
MLSVPTMAESETKLYVGIRNGIPYVFHQICVFGDILNIGDTPAYNVSFVFSITGGRDGEINETFSDTFQEMPPRTGWGFLENANGFGPVTITLTVHASNIDTITKTVKGFQIGESTLIPSPVLRNLLFAFLLRIYVY